jgi:hypothetical protein
MYFMQTWAKKFGCAWFNFSGTVPKCAEGKKLVLRIKLQGEGLVYDENGRIMQGITQILSKGDFFHNTIGKQIVDITDKAVAGNKVNVFVDGGFNGKLRFENMKAKLRRFDMAVPHPDVIAYYYDYLELFGLWLNLDKESQRR